MLDNADAVWGTSDSDTSLDDIPNPDLEVNNDRSVEDALAAYAKDDEAPEPTGDKPEVEAEAAPKVEAKTEEKPQETPAQAAAKQYTFKVNGQDVALDEGATIEHKVDGKKVQISVKDLVTNYAGSVPLAKRYTELDVERKKVVQANTEYESRVARQANMLRDMHTNITGGKLFEGVANLLELAGSKTDARAFMGELRKSMLEQMTQYSQMSEHERALLEEREAREYSDSRYQRIVRQQEERANAEKLQANVNATMDKHGMSMEEYAESKSFLEQAKKAGQLSKDITPELVAQLHTDTKIYRTAQKALTDAGFDPSKEARLEQEAVAMLRLNPEWTAEDLRDVFQQAATLKRGAAASQKIAKAPVATVVAADAKAKSAKVISKQKQREQLMLQDPAHYGDFSAEDTF